MNNPKPSPPSPSNAPPPVTPTAIRHIAQDGHRGLVTCARCGAILYQEDENRFLERGIVPDSKWHYPYKAGDPVLLAVNRQWRCIELVPTGDTIDCEFRLT